MRDFYSGKKILITGHTGFKGSWFTQILLNWGAEITGISLPSSTKPNLFEILGIEKKVKNNFVDIRDFERVKEIFQKEKPEIVVHLAAQAIVRDSYDDPLETFSTNTLGTVNILEAIKKTSSIKSAVIITTDKVYENNESGKAFCETDSLGGYDPYSASKAAADIVIQSYIRSFFNPDDYLGGNKTLIASARAGNVIGGGDWAPYRLVPDIMRSIYEKDGKVEIRNPQAVRPWEHVLEPLAGYLMLAKKLYDGGKEFSGAWNFGPNEESFVTVEGLANNMIEILDKGIIDIKPDGTKHEANILKLDTNKAKTILGWKPKFDFHENLQLTLDWYKNYYEETINPIEFTNKQIREFFKV